MTHHTTHIIAALALAGSLACSGAEEERKAPPPDAKRVDVSKAGSLTGRVTIDGPVPANEPLVMTGDSTCERAQKEGATLETFVSENGGLGNVFVYVKDGLGGYYFEAPAEPVVLDQKGCVYSPHVFGVQVGQRIQFVNSDPTAHNVHSLPKVNREFNFGQPLQNQKDTRVFSRPEVMVRFKCDMHGWMSAYAGVVEHPYFAVTRPDGQFELRNLPAGTYTVEAWHEALGTQADTVTLQDNASATLTFTFKAPSTSGP